MRIGAIAGRIAHRLIGGAVAIVASVVIVAGIIAGVAIIVAGIVASVAVIVTGIVASAVAIRPVARAIVSAVLAAVIDAVAILVMAGWDAVVRVRAGAGGIAHGLIVTGAVIILIAIAVGPTGVVVGVVANVAVRLIGGRWRGLIALINRRHERLGTVVGAGRIRRGRLRILWLGCKIRDGREVGSGPGLIAGDLRIGERDGRLDWHHGVTRRLRRHRAKDQDQGLGGWGNDQGVWGRREISDRRGVKADLGDTARPRDRDEGGDSQRQQRGVGKDLENPQPLHPT
jgi:hypothetical protein